MLNSVLVKAADRVINTKAVCQYTIQAHFINTSPGSQYSFYPLIIEGLILNKDYADNFADEIDLGMKVSPKDYALLQDQGQNLRCVLTITYVDKYGREVFDPPPISKQYHVVINDPRDIRKELPDVQAYTDPILEMSVRLIEPVVYKLRHTKINSVYQVMTIKDVIYAVTQAFGITKIHLVDPDNKHTYDHIDLSSYQGISSIYGYLQATYGVYEKGVNAYITNEVLYVYPPFETNPVYDRSAIFYQVDKGRYSGSHAFHRKEKDSISIVLNTEQETVDLSIAGAENVGTGFIFNRASHMTDGITTIDSSNGAQFTDQPSLSVTLTNPRTADGVAHNLFHIHGTDNPYPAMSEIIAHQASLTQVQWMNADPFQLDPCHKVTYYYDHNETMVKKTGIMEKAVYRISKLERIGTKDLFGAVGAITLRLSPNEAKTY